MNSSPHRSQPHSSASSRGTLLTLDGKVPRHERLPFEPGQPVWFWRSGEGKRGGKWVLRSFRGYSAYGVPLIASIGQPEAAPATAVYRPGSILPRIAGPVITGDVEPCHEP